MSDVFRFNKTLLDNGLRVITEAIPSVRSLAVGLWVHTGSRDEAPEEAGISHFIEHMVFKGTRRRRMHHIAQRMESVGGYLNAFTSKEYTCYYGRGLDEHLARAVDVVSDLVLDPTFNERELEKEKDVVLEEMKMYEDAPEEYIFDRFERALYAGHPLARPVIGLAETVRAFSRDQLVDYLGRHYTLGRMVLAVAGNVDHAHVVRQAERVFGDVQRPGEAPERTAVPPLRPGTLVERRPIQQAHLILGRRGFSIRDPRRTALTVLNTLLGGGMSSRLNQNIREKYGFCYNVYSFANMHSDTGDFGVYMGTDAGKVERARKLIWRELEKLADKPVSDRALSQVRNQVKGSLMLGQESMSNRMMRIGRQELIFRRYISLDEILAEVDAVTPEAVLELARELVQPEAFLSVVLLPDGSARSAEVTYEMELEA